MAKAKNSGGSGQAPRVAFYTRISTDEDHQKYSLGAQTERLEAFCKAQFGDDWLLHKVYRDTESGVLPVPPSAPPSGPSSSGSR